MSPQTEHPVLCVGLALGRTPGPATSYGVADTAGIQLLSDTEWSVWNLAGGVWSPTGRWGRADLTRAAHEAQIPDFEQTYEQLLRRGLLIELDQHGRWASRVRAHPLLSGIGELDPQGAEIGLGVLGAPPLVRLDSATFDCWQWLPFGDNLADAAAALGLTGGTHGWSTLADRVARLISHGAMYLHAVEVRQ